MNVLEIWTVTGPTHAAFRVHITGGLDLDDIRTPVGELTHSRGPSPHTCQIEHGEPGKRESVFRFRHIWSARILRLIAVNRHFQIEQRIFCPKPRELHKDP